MLFLIETFIATEIPAVDLQAQQVSMELALLNELNMGIVTPGEAFFRYLLPGDTSQHACCSWRGVGCISDVVTTLVLAQERDRIWSIRILWLPNTVRHAHFDIAGIMGTFDLRLLPRDLRYFNICRGIFYDKPADSLQLRDLPAKIEEFYVKNVQGVFFGKVLIDGLPQSLEILAIESWSINSVTIDCMPFYPSLKHIGIFGTIRKVRPVGGKEADHRFIHGSSPFGIPPSKYVDEYVRICTRIVDQL